MSDLKILVVDDSPTMRNILVNILKKAGYSNVKEAKNGRDALAELMVGDFNFIMTDWNMPIMNGLELTEAVRSDVSLKDLPIIMVTSRNIKNDVLNAIKSGVDGYIIKPFDTIALRDKIAEILGS